MLDLHHVVDVRRENGSALSIIDETLDFLDSLDEREGIDPDLA
jgi:hypothetical protein